MSGKILFRNSGRNRKYMPVNLNATKEDIQNIYKRYLFHSIHLLNFIK
jgi:hypothetical protein